MAGTIPLPTIHLNGTARETLLEQAITVCTAMRKAIDTMHGAAPNARDYYPQGTEAFSRAYNAHSLRVQRAAELLHEYQDLAEAIADGDPFARIEATERERSREERDDSPAGRDRRSRLREHAK